MGHGHKHQPDPSASTSGHVTLDPVSLATERGVHLLSANFKAGDVVIMPMFMLHGSLDNRSPVHRVRFSSDTRYQAASEPIDERWIGENPFTSVGLAILVGASMVLAGRATRF